MFLRKIPIMLCKKVKDQNPVNADNKGKGILVDDSPPVMKGFCNGEGSKSPGVDNVASVIVEEAPNEGVDGSNLLPHDAPYVVEIISDLDRVIHAALLMLILSVILSTGQKFMLIILIFPYLLCSSLWWSKILCRKLRLTI